MTSWTPLRAGPFEINSQLNPQALKAELEFATLFYKNISLTFDHSAECEDSAEDSASETFSDNSDSTSKSLNLYKTELCTSFMQYSTCPYNEKCKFAHGHHELRPIPRHPKYKSTLCRNFQNGSCPYGPRCCFLHPN